MKNIYLVGMMGAGKTETGRILAEELALSFLDLDDEIVDRVKLTINEIFESRGEAYFRNLEKESMRLVSRGADQVVATGGGVVLDPENVGMMKATGVVVYLRTPLVLLWERIRGKTDRPLLKVPNPQEMLGKLFYERKPHYEAAHDYAVNTEEKSPGEVARDVINLLGLARYGSH